MNCRLSPHRDLRPGMRRALAFTTLLFVVTAGYSDAFAGRLRGSVPNALSGVPGLRIVIQNLDVGQTFTSPVGPDGIFDVRDLPPGRVIVMAVTEGGEIPRALGSAAIRDDSVTELSLTPASSEKQTSAFNFILYKGEYYNNRTTEVAADPVTVTGGATTPNIDFSLSPGGGTISGQVTVEGTGAPAPGIVVVALGLSSFISSFDRTDASGNYTITGIPAGNYWVSVNTLTLSIDNDYVSEYYDNSRTSSGAALVPVVAGANTPGINFALTSGGSISGRILSGVVPGQGLPFAVVTAHSVSDPAFVVAVLTADDGTYIIRGLPAGSYTVEAGAETYLSLYYENAPTSALATHVVVVAGQDRPGTNITLSGGGIIQGTVRNQNTNEPLAGYTVTATNTDVNNPESRSGTSDASGTYTIEGLATGEYAVGVAELGRWYNNKSTIETATPVPVTAGSTVSGINITGIPSGTGECTKLPSQVGGITGAVTQASGGTPLGNVLVSIYNLPGDASPIAGALSDLSGAWSIGCLDPGTYYVQARAAFSPFLPAWYGGGTPQAVTVTAGATRPGVNLSMSSGGAISGRVTIAGSATGIEGVVVTARNTATQEEFTELTAANGDYVIDSGFSGGLPAGAYKVRADDYSTARLEYVPVELARFTATWTASGVELQWRVTDRSFYSGFHVYRSSSSVADGAATRLTASLLTGGPEYDFTDAGAVAGESYEYWLAALDRAGVETRFGPISTVAGEPAATRFLGVAPNPVRESAVVRFTLGSTSRVTLRVFDISGRLVRTLADDDFPAGSAAIPWNARADSGDEVPAGVYYLSLFTGTKSMGSKVVVTR